MAQFDPTQIERSVSGITFPADREDILAYVSKNGTDQEHIDALTLLLPGAYNSGEEILQALRGVDGAVKEASEEID